MKQALRLTLLFAVGCASQPGGKGRVVIQDANKGGAAVSERDEAGFRSVRTGHSSALERVQEFTES